MSMRVLFLGAGATGGYFGGRLAASGADVTFLVRPRRAAQLASHGLVVESPFGNFTTPAKTVTAADLRSGYDLVVVSCKSYDLADAIASLRPAIGPATQVLPLLNGLRHLATLDEAFGGNRVLGGLCHLSVTMADDGVIQHLNQLHLLTFGPRLAAQDRACRAMHAVFQNAGFESKLSGNVIHDMWGKWVLLATLAGMTCLMRASVGEIVATRDGRALMLTLLGECVDVAEASGERPDAAALAHVEALLTDPNSAVVASMLRDMQRGSRIEGDQIIGDMLQRANAFKVSAPLLRIAYSNLEAYQNRLAPQGG